MIRAMVAVAALFGCGLVGAQTIPLTYSPIASPELIVTGPARLATGTAGWIPLPDHGVKIPGEGQSERFKLAGEELTISWTGAKEFSITAGTKTRPLKPILKSYGFQPSTVELAGGRQYTLAFPVAQVGTTSEGRRAAVFYRSGSSQNGAVDGETVALYDANTDGVYKEGFDGIRVGPAGRPTVFSPLLKYFATSKGVYRIDSVAEDGTSLSISKYEGQPGKLHLEFDSGSSELCLILISADGQMSTVATASNKVRPDLLLIAGEYRVRYGLVATTPQGKITAVVTPASVPAMSVEEGQTATVGLGGPFKLALEAKKDGAQFRIDPETLVLSGRGGETYASYAWSSPPQVSVSGKRLGTIGIVDGKLTEFVGEGTGKVTVTGVVEGLGPVRGEAEVDTGHQ